MARRLTERQRNSKQARKIKARQQWQYSLKCKLQKLALVVVLFAAGAFVYGLATGEVQQTYAQALNNTHRAIADTGLAVEHIHVSGRQRTGMTEVKNALGFELGESMIRVDLDDLRLRLEELPTVKRAAVSRIFPNQVMIHLSEREPVAIWQQQGELKLIDELGAVITDLNLHQYKDLPLLVGVGAPKEVATAMQLLDMNERLASQIQSFIRVGNRRWDVRFKHGVTVKLPEENYSEAWKKLVKMNEDEELLHRHIEAIDMRNGERMYITVAPGKDKVPLIPTKDT